MLLLFWSVVGYSEKEIKQRAMKRKEKNPLTGGRKIPLAYRRITVVPPHTIAIVYHPLEVMRQALREANNDQKKE